MTETLTDIDAARETIASRVESKRGSTAALAMKKTNLTNQISTYENSIRNHEEKIVKLTARVETYQRSLEDTTSDLARRSEELVHLEELLARYDEMKQEQMECFAVMRRRIEEVPDWYPGMDESLKGGITKDPEYLGARDRKDYLEIAMQTTLSDVNRIYFSRGEVSTLNAKESNV